MNRAGLLVSVRNATEARAALEGGADVIDVKEPLRRALGRADGEAIREVIAVVGGRRPVSVAWGELCDMAVTQEETRVPPGVNFLKIGLSRAPHDWRERLARCVSGLDSGVRLIAVAYGDHARAGSPAAREVLEWGVEHQATGLLIDTCVKDGSSLLDWMRERELVDVIKKCRDAGLLIALAGSLRGESLLRVATLQPDVIGVRGAACVANDRQGVIEVQRVRALREELAGAEPVAQCPSPSGRGWTVLRPGEGVGVRVITPFAG